MKVESHERRERPSWFRADMAGNREMLRNKRIIVMALVDMMRLISASRFLRVDAGILKSKEVFLFKFFKLISYWKWTKKWGLEGHISLWFLKYLNSM